MAALQSEVVGLVSRRSKLFETGFEQKRVDVARRLDERISKLSGLSSTCKILPQTEQHALGRHRHDISNTPSLPTTTCATTLQTCNIAKRPEQLSNRSNDSSTCGANHDILRLCGSALSDSPSTQTGRDVLRPCGSISWLNTPRTEVDSDTLFSCGSIPQWNTLRQQAQPRGADTNHNVLQRHGVEITHQSTEKSTVGGKRGRDLEFHIRKIHEIEQKGSCLSDTSTTDGSQNHDAQSIHFESHGCVTVPAVKLDASIPIKLNHSIVSSQSPHSVSEHPNSALLPVQEEETTAPDLDVTQFMYQRSLTHERNFPHECNLTYERHLREELETERSKVEALRIEVHATRQDLHDERERAASREQEFTHEVGVLRTEGELMQVNCANCKNYQLKIGDLEAALVEKARDYELVVDDCAELANLRLQLACEIEKRTLQERAYDTANAEKEEYVLKLEKLNAEHQKHQATLKEIEKINVGLELQRTSNAEVDKQRKDMCDRQSALLQRLEAELEQTQRDLVIERELVVRLLLQIQQLQLEVKREKEHSSSQEIQLRDVFEEIKQQRGKSSSHFPFPHVETSQQTGPPRKLESSQNQAHLNISQQKTKPQQVLQENNGLWTKQDDKQNLISDFSEKIDVQVKRRTKLQTVEDLTRAPHLHVDHCLNTNQEKRQTPVYGGVMEVVDQMQKTTTIRQVSPPSHSVQEKSLGCRDRLTSWETTSTTSLGTTATIPPACDKVPPRSQTFG